MIKLLTHWPITNAGSRSLLFVFLQHWLEGPRIYRISGTIASNSYEPPTALHHGGVFCLIKNKGGILCHHQYWLIIIILVMRYIMQAKLTRDEVTKILGLLSRQLHKYENGRELIPESVLYRLFYNGLLMLFARRYNKNNGDK